MRESRHKIDELEEKAVLVDPVKANAQEAELRDLRCKVNFTNNLVCLSLFCRWKNCKLDVMNAHFRQKGCFCNQNIYINCEK